MSDTHKTQSELLDEIRDLRARVAEVEQEAAKRRQAEEALARERDLLHTLMDHIPDTIYFKDEQGRFTRINRAQAEILGVSDPADAIGKTDLDFFQPEHAGDGAWAMDLFHSHRAEIQLLILDLDLPKRSGLDVLREIRDGGSLVPAILITAHAHVDLEDQIDENSYLLPKPFQMADIAQLVAQLVAETRGNTDAGPQPPAQAAGTPEG